MVDDLDVVCGLDVSIDTGAPADGDTCEAVEEDDEEAIVAADDGAIEAGSTTAR